MRLIIVIPVEEKETANAFCATIAAGGAGTFTVGLSPNGQEPVSHYWCNWQMTQEQYDAVKAEFKHVFDVPFWAPETVLAEMGLQRIQELFS